MHLVSLALSPGWVLASLNVQEPAPPEPGVEEQIQSLREANELQRNKIEQLERLLDRDGNLASARIESERQDEPARTMSGEEHAHGAEDSLWSSDLGFANLRMLHVSLDLLMAAGTSTEENDSIEQLEGGAHDPKRRGFTLQNAELSLLGSVDPYFDVETYIVLTLDPESGETEVELEEAFAKTRQLSGNLDLEVGHIFSEFGVINPLHPHQWEFVDQPVVNTRLLGPDGARALGFRVGWLAPLPFESHLHVGMQNADQEQMSSFLGSFEHGHEEGEGGLDEGLGGRPLVDRDESDLGDFVYLARWASSFQADQAWSTTLGLSFLHGPNASGEDGRTTIYGTDLMVEWKPDPSKPRGAVWQTEIMKREWYADHFFSAEDESDPTDDVVLDDDLLLDFGLYSQVLYFVDEHWSTGLRYEVASGEGDGTEVAREDDPFRDDRTRISPLIAWRPSEFTRIRLQYNYDRADHLEHDDAHSFWLGVEFLIGSHGSHAH